MYNLIWADLFKLQKSTVVKVMFGITTISALAMAIIAYLIPQGTLDGSMIGIGFMFSDINVISILGAVIAGVYICGDFDNKTIHDAIAIGNSRAFVIISKTIVFSSTLGFILLPYVIITGLGLSTGYVFSMGSVAIGFLHMLTSTDPTTVLVSGIGKILAVMLTLMIVYVAQLSICVPLAFVLKKPVPVVAIYYGLSILSGQLMVLSAKYPVFNRFFASTPYGGNHVFVTLDTGIGDILGTIAVSLLFIVIMIAVTYILFRKSEIK